MSNCPCDTIVFPPSLVIPAGLTDLPRQIAAFPEFRAAMLAAIPGKTPLAAWRARSDDEFGIMLLEMWAYVCDSISFYDSVIAHESYLPTARLRASIRKLVGLLGYIPRPASSATASLAVLADGRKPVLLPAGTAFRSGAFEGSPPQVFELERAATIHPFYNEWALAPIKRTALSGSLSSLLFEPGNVAAKKGDALLVLKPGADVAAVVDKIGPHTGDDGESYRKADLGRSINFGSASPLTGIKAFKPIATALLAVARDPDYDWSIVPQAFFLMFGEIVPGDALVLDDLYPRLRKGDYILLSRGEEFRWFQIFRADRTDFTIAPARTMTITTGGTTTTVTTPAVTIPITWVILDTTLDQPSRSSLPSPGSWADVDPKEITVHFTMIEAGVVTAEAETTIDRADPLRFKPAVEVDPDVPVPSRFQFEDKNLDGVEVTGLLNAPTATLSLDQTAKWDTSLTVPVKVFGNIVPATRGETVSGEFLGVADASLANQTFTLKKKPLTYVPSPTVGNETGVSSTLKVYVGGVLWTEVRSFFGQGPDAEVFIVRHDDETTTFVTFGDGKRGRRPPSGAAIVAYYRYGAGAASPPAGSITQLARSVPGLRAVKNPVPAVGGMDAESASNLRTFAPRSALLLGRAVSIQDFEAGAAAQGPTAVAAEWRWNEERQRPVVQIFYIGATGLEDRILQALRGISDPTTSIDVDRALPISAELSIDVEIDPRYLEANVLADVKAALFNPLSGPIALERIGIGRPLYRSQIFRTVTGAPGADAVRSIHVNSAPFVAFALSPGAGYYFDFTGRLHLNGKVV